MVDLFNGRWMFKAYGSFAHTNINEYDPSLTSINLFYLYYAHKKKKKFYE